MALYGVIMAGHAGYNHTTIVEVKNGEGDKIAVRPLNKAIYTHASMDDVIAVERVSKVTEDTDHLKTDDLFYEVDFVDVTNEVVGYDSHGHELKLDVTILEEVED